MAEYTLVEHMGTVKSYSGDLASLDKQKLNVHKAYRIKDIESKQNPKKSKTKEICKHIRNQEWNKLIPYVDELIFEIKRDAVSVRSVSKLLESTSQDYDIMKKNLLVHVVNTITILLKEVMVSVVSDKNKAALLYAIRIKDILETAKEVSYIASKEGLTQLPVSAITQIDVIEGKPIYAVE